jgi:hypothetical protein
MTRESPGLALLPCNQCGHKAAAIVRVIHRKPSLHNCDVLMAIDKKDALSARQLSRAKSTDSPRA